MPTVRSFGTPPPIEREFTISPVGAGSGTSPPDARARGDEIAHDIWRIPAETPVAFIYNGRNHAVMLATPEDLADFAVGFSLTERIIASLDELTAIEIHYGDKGVDLRMSIAADALERLDLRQRRRNLVGRAGCGVCGVGNAETFFERLAPVRGSKTVIPAAALLRAARELAKHQPLNARTHTVHAAAFASPAGEILLAREDVGRHNALDKLIGAMAAQGGTTDGFVVMSSRCSYEIVEKAARAGVRAVLSLSGPTAFAVAKAAEANIPLYALAEGCVVEISG